MKILVPFISLLLAFYICYIIIPVVIRIAHLKNLVDEPNNRTAHKKAIPTLGGIGIFLSSSIVSLFFASYYFIPEFNFLLLGMLILFFLGIKDDILVLSPTKKLAAQIIVAIIITTMGDIRITSFQGILGIYELPYLASVAISSFIFIALINAINLIDGIDGLASGFGILATLFFGINFYLIGHYGWTMLAFSMVGSLCGFFLYNVYGKTNKIFMGDTGSLVLGLFLTTISIKFIEINGISTSPFSIYTAPAMAIGVLFLPIFDTIRIFSIRIANGNSPFKPDKKHLHHMLLRLGMNHRKATYTLLSINFLAIAVAYSLERANVNSNFIILALIVIALSVLAVIHFALIKMENKKKKEQEILQLTPNDIIRDLMPYNLKKTETKSILDKTRYN